VRGKASKYRRREKPFEGRIWITTKKQAVAVACGGDGPRDDRATVFEDRVGTRQRVRAGGRNQGKDAKQMIREEVIVVACWYWRKRPEPLSLRTESERDREPYDGKKDNPRKDGHRMTRKEAVAVARCYWEQVVRGQCRCLLRTKSKKKE
jgi:hypothetical protein